MERQWMILRNGKQWENFFEQQRHAIERAMKLQALDSFNEYTVHEMETEKADVVRIKRLEMQKKESDTRIAFLEDSLALLVEKLLLHVDFNHMNHNQMDKLYDIIRELDKRGE